MGISEEVSTYVGSDLQRSCKVKHGSALDAAVVPYCVTYGYKYSYRKLHVLVQ